MRNSWFKKGLVVGIIVLLIGVGVQSAFAVDIPEKEEIEPKEYLFETIVTIANNPDVQDLLEESEHNIINFDFNNKYVFRQLLFKNPELLYSMVFTKPLMTKQHLDIAYKQGIELVEILGKEKTFEMLNSIEITNPKLLDDLNNIIMNDEELSNRILSLIELNEDNSTICEILNILMFTTLIRSEINDVFSGMLEDFPLLCAFFEIRSILLIVRVFIFYALIVKLCFT